MKKRQGISLIVLVITIIVMIILAAAVVVSLSNTGIIGKADVAVKKTNLKQIESLASLAWADAFMDGARTQAELEAAVNKALEDVNVNGYTIVVTEKGVTVTDGDGNSTTIPTTPSVDLSKAVITPVAGSSVENIKAGNPIKGDTVEFEGYKYIYDQENSQAGELKDFTENTIGHGWGVMVTDKTKTVYPAMQEEIFGVPVVSAAFAYSGCDKMIACPKLPANQIMTGGMFYECKGLTSVPRLDYETIHVGMFMYCENVKGTLTLSKNVKEIQLWAFGMCPVEKVVYEGSVADWCAMIFDGQGSNGLYYGAELYIDGQVVTNLVIPNTVTKVNDFTFDDCKTMTDVTIPSSVKEIGWCAFRNTSLTNVTIPVSVTVLERKAFENSKLENVYYTGTLNDWLNMELVLDDVYEDTENYGPSNPAAYGANLYINGQELTNITIPDGVTELKNCVFEGTKITSITIPSTVTKIGSYALAECENLTTINFAGTETQWNAITFATNWNYNSTKYTVNFAQ